MRKLLPVVLAAFGCLVVGVAPAGAASSQLVYSSLPASGVVSVPSAGAEALEFNQLGNEVILTKASTVVKVSVTMNSQACETGGGITCATTSGATFPTPVTLTLYKHSTTDTTTGEVTPGAQIVTLTKTFKIKFRPSADPTCGNPSQFRGSDGACHNGLDQNIVWDLPKNTKLPATVVWGISYNTDNSGPNPIGGSGAPQDALNIGFTAKPTTGLNRADWSIFWDTRNAGNACGSPFVTGDFNRDGPCSGWANLVPAAKFTIPS